jgi:hypothetical protein
MSLLSPPNRRTVAALLLATSLPLVLPSAPASAARIRPHPSAARPAVVAPLSWRSLSGLAELWHRLIRLAALPDTAADPGRGLPTDENGGGIDPNGKPKPAPTHP